MFISMRYYGYGAGTAQDIGKKVEEEFIPIVSGIDGFVEYYVVDVGDGHITSISIFESKAGAEESDAKAAEWAPDALTDFDVTAPRIAEGEVVAGKA